MISLGTCRRAATGTRPAPVGWILAGATGETGETGRTVPRDHAAYARVCHPAERDRGWSNGAKSWPRRDGAMRWHALVGSSDPVNLTGSVWRNFPPERGT
ncbi:hypothetical protein P3102_28865 [Amycolatopsis sp. QT-25]|uniref:hypothetical protein n=1 Tax=Amycolatopsis sp. QT-25 TaxID=3034022 RepID=UPI0023EB7F28|nr:hypothetical protein [Amycolatopsis sp. QT-25]WET78049.1 hypothetical protein P3102_28865 [Amycolatopsis sp. QT-25]